METTAIDSGIIKAIEITGVLRPKDKVRVISIDPADGYYQYRGDVIGSLLEYKGVGYFSFLEQVGPWKAGDACVFLHKEGTLFEIIKDEEEIEEMPVKRKTTTKAAKVVVRKPRRKVIEYATTGWKTLDGCFKVPNGIYNILKRNINKSVNTMLLGPTGVGKTELAAKIAWELGREVHIFDMGTMTDPITGLVGSHVIFVKDGKTISEFRKSRFSDVIQKECVIILDEISRASAQANNLLFPCLDFRKELAMEYCFEDTTPIKVHDKCVFIATANLGSQYTGTHKLDRALLDRFMLVEIDPLQTTQIKETLKYHSPKVTIVELDKIVSCYNQINKAHEDYTVSFNLSLRHLKMITAMVEDGFTIYDSFYVICKGLGSKDGLKSLESILNTTKV